jgi:hypothetical protein
VTTALRADAGGPRTSDARLESLKVYLRNADDYDRLIPRVRQLFSIPAPLVLRADICRPDLLVEIEGTYALE